MHKSENRKPTFDLALGFEIDYQCESSYFNLVRESKHRIVDLRTFDEVVWSATYPSETDV